MFGVPPSKAEQVNCLHVRRFETPLGAMLAQAYEKGHHHLLKFVDRRGMEREIACLVNRNRCTVVPGNNSHLEEIGKELKDYLTVRQRTSPCRFVTDGSAFEDVVWALLRTIPPGEKWSYARLAQTLNRPMAMRVVGRANGRNCLALLIPYHRVISADGNCAAMAAFGVSSGCSNTSDKSSGRRRRNGESG
jgi:AraC family transcriptional regulator of adaptative response/methylated-DNA-[protein]-cysteine methyltransferase